MGVYGTIYKSSRYVYVNVDIAIATQFWQPCFSKFACHLYKLFISIFTH